MRAIITLTLLTALSVANTQAQQLSINELQVANTDQIIDPSFNYGPWLELYNSASTEADITGWWVSDDPDNLQMAKISRSTKVPAKGFATLWFDNHSKYYPSQINMKPDVNGGTLYLSDKNGNLKLQVEYPAQIARCSWARTTDGTGTWSFCSTPTPTATNAGSKFASERLPAPEPSIESQIFSGSISMQVPIPEGCTLRFTSNGSAPTLTNGTTTSTGKFSVSTTRVYRFCLFKDGYLPSPVVTRTLIKRDYDFDIPVLAICSSDANYNGGDYGIFTEGNRKNGRPGRGKSYNVNWNHDWERPSNFEYFTPEGKCVINQEVDVDRCGGWSRGWEPWSFKVKASKEYEGQKTLDYQFFPDKPYLKHKALQVRNGGNDNWCRIKDPALQEVIRTSGLYVDCQSYMPVAHYVNGNYKGTINVRQPNNKDFAYSEYGLDDDYLDLFEMSPDSGYVQMRGTKDSFRQWYTLSKSCSSDAVYEQICDIVDIDEYINSMAVQLYLGGTDWPQNNVKGFKSQLDGGKWHIVLFDLDFAFNESSNAFNTFANKQNYTFDQLYGESQNRITAEIEFVTIFLNMLNNAKFRKQFIDAFCIVAGSVFEPNRCKQIITELADRVAPMQSTFNWGSPWNTANEVISNLSATRQTTMTTALRNYSKMKISGVTPMTVNMTANTAEAHLLINGLPVPTDKFGGKLFSPITLSAVAPEGYRFAGWRKAETSTSTIMAAGSAWKYYDQGSLDGKNWTALTYTEPNWKSGNGPLGYYTGGSRDYKTTLNYGSDANNKYPTYYFRKTLTLDTKPAASDVFTLDFIVDDGCVVYVNGTEAGRYNMPNGSVSYSTFASSYAPGNPDTGSMTLDASLFKAGTNVIAVEVHNNNANSTDIYWEASLSMTSSVGSTIVCETADYKLPQTGTHNLVACFEPLPEGERTGTASHPVVINEVSAQNETFANEFYKRVDWLELYNTTDRDIDLTGMYLTDNLSKPQKYQFAQQGTESLVIPAHGFKVVWCDKVAGATQLHAGFKLGNDDESAIMLSAADGAWADTLIYCAHTPAETVGRYPDGSDNLYIFNRATIGASNGITTAAIPYEQPHLGTGIIDELPEASLSSGDDHYRVFDISGRLISEGDGPVRLSGFSSGAYIIRRGNEATKVIR